MHPAQPRFARPGGVHNNKNCGLLQDTNKHFLTKYFVKTGNIRRIGKQQNDSLFTKVTKYWRWKLHSFETEIDAQACNVS